VLLAVAVLAAAAAAVLGWRWQQASARRDEGLRLARAGHFADAAPLLRQAFDRDRDDAEVVTALAEGAWRAGDPDAEEYLTRWCELRPREVKPYRMRMDLRHRTALGKWAAADKLRVMEGAVDDGRRVLELDPGNDEVRRELAGLLVQVGRFDEAEAACRASLARAPGDPRLLYLLARTLHPQGKRAEAEAVLDPVVRAYPNYGDALLLRAILYREADQPDKAVPLLLQARALSSPPPKDCLYHLGLALAATGQEEEAKRVMAELDRRTLEDAVRDNIPETPAMRVHIAEAMLGAGQAEEARAKLEAVLAETPDYAPAHRVLALYYEQKGRPEKAAEHRRKSEGVRE
jgi:tetratricopeptide (TPR) repeat protein